MPGTGKTTTIAHIIQILVKQGKSILLTSYTHTAVDNVLSKVRDSGIDVLRIGNIEKVRNVEVESRVNGPIVDLMLIFLIGFPSIT
jgi:superfamily I DNA/RNA helicase